MAHFGHDWTRSSVSRNRIPCCQTTQRQTGDITMTAQRPILIVEDDETLRDILAEHLADGHGFTITTAATLEAADKAINDKDARFDAVILDIGLPDGDGRDYCARLRRQGHHDA